jgi:hypothetical protein
VLIGKAMVGGLRQDFLCRFVASAHFMRLSLKKAAHAVLSSAAYRKSGSPPVFFGPGTPTASLGRLAEPGAAVRGETSWSLDNLKVVP